MTAAPARAPILKRLLVPCEQDLGIQGQDFLELPWLRYFAFLVIAVLAVLFAFLAFFIELNWDELQFVISAYRVAHGARLYADAWDNHGPMMTWILALAVRLLSPTSYSFILLIRALMLVFEALTGVLVFLWVRTAFPGPSMIAWMAVAFFLATPVMILKGAEIRGDNPMNLLWVLSLFLWFIAWKRNRPSGYFWSGLALGACFLFSVKTLMLGAAVGTMFLSDMFWKRRIALKPMIWFGLGTAIAPLLMFLILVGRGTWGDFMATFVGQNFDRPRPPIDEGYKTLKSVSADWANVAYVTMFYALVQSVRRVAPPAIALLTPCAIFLVFQFLFLIPTHHLQSFLVALPPIAVLMSWSLADALCRLPLESIMDKGKMVRSGLAAFALVYMPVSSMYCVPWKYGNQLVAELAYGDKLMTVITDREAIVFDGVGHPLFNPRPTEYLSLVHTVRLRIRAGQLKVDFAKVLAEKDVRYVIFDHRVRTITEELNGFIEANYIPLSLNPLLAAGKVLRNPEASRFDIHIAGEYFAETKDGPASFTLNGKPATSPVLLQDGEYTVQWEGTGPLILSTQPRKDWMEFDRISTINYEDWDEDYRFE